MRERGREAEEMESREKMHVVMVALPTPGNIIPMLDFSLKLASKGVKITFVNSEFNRAALRLPSNTTSEDAHQENDKLYSSMTFLYIPDGLPPEHHCRDPVALLSAVDASYGLHFGKLLQNQVSAQGPPISCIVGNSFARHVQEAADSLGLPYIAFWTQSAASLASIFMVAKGYRPPQDSQLCDLLPPSLLPGMPGLQIGELNSFLQSINEEDFMYRFFMSTMQRIKEAQCILMNTFEELEEETISALHKKEDLQVLPIGPLLPQSFFDEDDTISLTTSLWVSEDLHCISWLDKQEDSSVIYVSFGSVISLSKEQLEQIAVGLEASRKAFLWVIRPRMMEAEEVTLPEGFLERTAERGLIVPWAPQLRVLCHRAVAAFLTHCGWNSTLEGICGGMPMLCYPIISDQATNGRCIIDGWHMGLTLETIPGGVVAGEEVEKKVVELMCGARCEGLRANAREWRRVATDAVSGSSSLNIERFIALYENVSI